MAASLELVLLRVTDASEEKADAADIGTIREFTTADGTDVMQCNALIHWLASRLQTDDSSAKIKSLALIKNLANEGGALFQYSIRGMVQPDSGSIEMLANLERCSMCKLAPHPIHKDKPERMVHKHAMATLAYIKAPMEKDEKKAADRMIKEIIEAGDLSGGKEAALGLIKAFLSRGEKGDCIGSILDDAALAVEAVVPALPVGVTCELLDVLGGGVSLQNTPNNPTGAF